MTTIIIMKKKWHIVRTPIRKL